MTQEKQIAMVKGTTLYRHTYVGETIFAERGENLPISSMGSGVWEAWVGDNECKGEGEIIVLIDGLPICCAVMINIPEVHQVINLKGKSEGLYNYNGSYRIMRVEIGKEHDEEYFHIYTIRAGDIDDSKLIHTVKTANWHPVKDGYSIKWEFIWNIKELIKPLTM